MKPELLKPILDRKAYSDTIAKKLEFELYVNIFKPVMDILGIRLSQIAPGRAKALKANAKGELLAKSLELGIVALAGGYVVGRFNAELSKEIRSLGGVWDKRKKAWKLNLANLSIDTKQKIQSAQAANLDKANKAMDKLLEIQKSGFPEIDVSGISDMILDDLRKQFDTTAATKLEIPMAYSGFISKELKDGYTENLDLYIKGWANESVVRLLGQVQESASRGYRAESMREAIQAEYGVSQRKAKFIARQETSLLVSKFREATYKEAGVPAYQWSTSSDHRVRDSHKDLNGTIHRWDSPPIVDPVKGRRAHPGEDFGCRCVAIPILESQLQPA